MDLFLTRNKSTKGKHSILEDRLPSKIVAYIKSSANKGKKGTVRTFCYLILCTLLLFQLDRSL